MLHELQAHSSFLTRSQVPVPINSSTQPASCGFAIAQELIDSNGWVRCNKGLLFWVPEDFRNGLSSLAILTIPTTSRYRRVRVNLDNFRYGSTWTSVREDVWQKLIYFFVKCIWYAFISLTHVCVVSLNPRRLFASVGCIAIGPLSIYWRVV